MTNELEQEAGFTLIELLIAVAIMAIIVPSIAMAIIVGLKNFGGASTRVSNSTSAQLAARYFPTDVSSAGNPSADVVVDPAYAVGDPGTGNYTPSNSDVECSTVANLLRLSGSIQNADGSSHPYSAAYVLAPDTRGWAITRYYCIDGGRQVNRIIRHINGNAAGDVQVTVGDTPSTRGLVTLRVRGTVQRPAEPNGFTWSLTGYRRSS